MDADICETCDHYAASRVPGTLGLCALLDQPVRFENSCEKWTGDDHHYEPAVPFTDDATGSDAELDALVRGE